VCRSVDAFVVTRFATDVHATIVTWLARGMQAAIITHFAGTVNAVVVAYFAGAVNPIIVMPGLMHAMVVTRFGMGATASRGRGCAAGMP
jgi:ABC-type multidrug transport system permease subunit